MIRATNWRYRQWELDIVAWDPRAQELVFVEVKSRRSGHTGNYDHAGLAVDGRKLHAVAVASRAYLIHLDETCLDTTSYRLDIITVTGSKIEWFRNVTWLT